MFVVFSVAKRGKEYPGWRVFVGPGSGQYDVVDVIIVVVVVVEGSDILGCWTCVVFVQSSVVL